MKNIEINSNDKKLEQLYEMIIDSVPLTNQTLIKYGFSNTEISNFIDSGIITKQDNNQYQLVCIQELYYYGIKLILTNQVKRGNICFRRCHKLDPNNRDIYLQLFLSTIRLSQYNEAFIWFSKIEKISPEEYHSDNNLYLYLLCMVTSCPKEYQERLMSIDYDDLLIPRDIYYYHKEEENNIRQSLLKNKYKSAMKLLNNMINKEQIYVVSHQLLKELLLQVINSEDKFNTTLIELANDNKYKSIINYIEAKSKKRYLSNVETYAYLLTKTIINIQETRTIPTTTIEKTDSMYDAIKGNNFKLAKILNDKFLKISKLPENKDIVNILLFKLNKLIDKITKENISLRKDSKELTPEETSNAIIENNSINDKVDLEKKKLSFAEELAYYIKAENIPLTEAIKSMGIVPEQVLLIKLFYARDYYIEGMEQMGDKLLKEVEKSKDKTEEVKKLLNEIKTNKRFYKNRIDINTRKRTKN